MQNPDNSEGQSGHSEGPEKFRSSLRIVKNYCFFVSFLICSYGCYQKIIENTCTVVKLFIMNFIQGWLQPTVHGSDIPGKVSWLPVPKWRMHICTKNSCTSVGNCEASGSVNRFKITHNNLTYPYYLMLKREGCCEYTFGVKNIQKSELRTLHKFEQVFFSQDIARKAPAYFRAQWGENR